MTQLYKWSTNEQIDQLKQYLAYRGPTTTSFLGYILSTHACESDSPGKSVIWTSHQDPLNTTDVVVWLIDSDHRTRFFVNSEVVLNSKEMTAEAISLEYNTSDPDKLPPYFKNIQDEELYKRSLKTAEKFLTMYMDQRYGSDTGEFYHDTSLLWAPIFYKLFEINLDVPCFVFSRQVSKPLDPIKLPPNYTVDRLDPTDVNTVVTKNKLAYDPKYVLDCFRISSAIRANGELIAWGMTHRDCNAVMLI
ncbi:hypothetical protein [Parasitella parasitica]|uniref:Uncharacterized protein n=1 Tax=Parasitella parasitica TaxID=35722 RepID=A0A0B7NHY1_9FUNG|nr:hypothetical protein [Parasitella parasitica]